MRLLIPATAALCGLAVLALTQPPAHAKKAAAPKPSAAQIAQGKALSSSLHCDGCHSADLAGKPKFSPSLRANGVTKAYSLAAFEKVLNTGVTVRGGQVKPPMPVCHLPKAKSDALYAYFKTLK